MEKLNLNDPINVLSTFNGIGCIWLALEDQGIKVNKRYSSEIDKFANKANDALYPDTIQLGDINKVKAKDLERIDLFVGGSPCQGFSFAGKQLNFDDPRSALFFEFVRLWNEIKKINPDAKFLLENVNMKKNELRIISEYLGVFPVNINSNKVSAQNRNRWYWSNIRTKETGLFRELWTDIPQPRDKGILLKDILQQESEIDEKYYMNPETIKGLMNNNRFSPHDKFDKKSYTVLTHPQRSNSNFIKLDKQGNKKADQDKAGCLTCGGNSGGNHSDMDIICVLMVGRKLDKNGTRKDLNPNIKAKQQLELAPVNKTNCLTTVAKDNLILQLGRGFNKGGYHIDKSPTLTSNSWEQNNLLQQNYKLRRLTPKECGRLQTVPENKLNIMLNSGISDTQLYKMFGNGWTIKVISHVVSFMK